eukprot:gb/GECG01012594.1/.p1 GENE.gb/GECG01012594.1/~~gb/GECG01012594.1/.p1  ORF type:complete len:494 (+),score=55.92 gb/GECG01012594.1/:1-1482(+)
MSSTPGPYSRQETSATPQMGVLDLNRESNQGDADTSPRLNTDQDQQDTGVRNHAARTLRLCQPSCDDDECDGGTNMGNWGTSSTPLNSATSNPSEGGSFGPAFSSRADSAQNPHAGSSTPSEQTAFREYANDNANATSRSEGAQASGNTHVGTNGQPRSTSKTEQLQTGASIAVEESSPPKPNPKRGVRLFFSISDLSGIHAPHGSVSAQDCVPELHDGGSSPNVNKRQRCDTDEDNIFGRRGTAANDPLTPASTPTTPFLSTEGFPDATNSEKHILPCEDGKSEKWPNVISPETLKRVLDGHYSSKDTEFWIIDCRFPYEYQGGHIMEATNLMDPFQLKDTMFPPNANKKRVFIMHCEFSSHRAPKMLSAMRNLDRALVGGEHWPKLYVPELYLLKGGYQAFYEKFPDYCTPREYVRMDSENHAAKRAEMQRLVQQKHTNFNDQTKSNNCLRRSHSGPRRHGTSPAPRVCRSASELFDRGPPRMFDYDSEED